MGPSHRHGQAKSRPRKFDRNLGAVSTDLDDNVLLPGSSILAHVSRMALPLRHVDLWDPAEEELELLHRNTEAGTLEQDAGETFTRERRWPPFLLSPVGDTKPGPMVTSASCHRHAREHLASRPGLWRASFLDLSPAHLHLARQLRIAPRSDPTLCLLALSGVIASRDRCPGHGLHG